MSDINKVWVSGVVISDPILTKLSSKTPIASFIIQVNEKFIDRSGEAQVKPNLIKVESLGRSAERVIKLVKKGARYTIDGYLRQDHIDGFDQIRIRTFAVYSDDSGDNLAHKSGLNQAVRILRKSPDVKTAIARIEELIES